MMPTNTAPYRPANTQVLSREQLEAIQQFDTCMIANAIETLSVRLRNEGFTRPGLRSFTPAAARAIGYAATGRVRSANPPITSDHRSYDDRTDWWEWMLSLPGPRLAVVEDVDKVPGLGAWIGEVHAAILQALDCAGVVTNGSVRDLDALAAGRFAAFACHASVSHAYIHMIDFGQDVQVCGLTVRTGDLVYADAHGAINIPASVAADVADVAARLSRNERKIIDLCRSSNFSLEQLRQTVKEQKDQS